ncbi:MAG: elongation factor Ts [Saprospiraceae bacterium]|nr:elongation factor Ts [Saprospiraceae bacterium]
MSVKITATMVKELRDKTGAGMMDCKKALAEANGDFETAIANLRKKGQKLSDSRADRATTEGVVIALTSEDGKRGVAVNIGCETDFVAKNDDFVKFAQSIADVALANFPATKEALLALDLNGITIGEKIIEQTGVIGEKIELSKYETLEAELVVPYIHMGYKMGVLLSLTQNNEAAIEAGKNAAMQVAAMNPVAVDKDGVDASVIEREIEIGKEQARNDGRPEAILEKIALGKLNKFYKESTLMNQQYVKDNKLTISEYLNSESKGLKAVAFKRVTLG